MKVVATRHANLTGTNRQFCTTQARLDDVQQSSPGEHMASRVFSSIIKGFIFQAIKSFPQNLRLNLPLKHLTGPTRALY